MVYKVCTRCSKMFETTKVSYCTTCLEINEDEFSLIIDYISQMLEINTEIMEQSVMPHLGGSLDISI